MSRHEGGEGGLVTVGDEASEQVALAQSRDGPEAKDAIDLGQDKPRITSQDAVNSPSANLFRSILC